MEKELYTQREAAKRLRIDPKTLRRLVREGRLPEVRLGPRLPRYRGQDLDALVNYLNTTGPSGPNGQAWTAESYQQEMARLAA